ncbi:MAG: DUF1059 domain-containing protein [Thermoprotei archaeon]
MVGYKVNLKEVCGCNLELKGATKAAVADSAAAHAKNAHSIAQVPPELSEKLMKAIKEE